MCPSLFSSFSRLASMSWMVEWYTRPTSEIPRFRQSLSDEGVIRQSFMGVLADYDALNLSCTSKPAIIDISVSRTWWYKQRVKVPRQLILVSRRAARRGLRKCHPYAPSFSLATPAKPSVIGGSGLASSPRYSFIQLQPPPLHD